MPKGTIISVDPVKVQSVINAIENQRAIIESNLNSIKHYAVGLKSLWEGESADAYQSVMSSLDQNTPEIVNILQEYINDLNEINVNYIGTDRTVKIVNEGLPSDVFNI